MYKVPYQYKKELLNVQNILEQGEKIYKISEVSDKRCLELNPIDNWAEVFYNVKKDIFRKRYIELMSRTENNKFFEALNYEYGINNNPLDLNKAFQIYKNAADTSNDTLSMFRLYRIYKNEYKKFNFSKRNIVLEKYYLFKCFSYLTNEELNKGSLLFKRIDVMKETFIQFEEEDPNFCKLEKLFKHLKKYYKIYNIALYDLKFVQAVLSGFYYEEGKENVKIQLKKLSEDNNLEPIYKIICLNLDKENEKYYYEILYKNNYYRSYIDYAYYLYEKEHKQKAMEVLRDVYKKGYYFAITSYFTLFFELNEFEDIMNSPMKKNDFLFIIGGIIDNIIADGVYSIYEFIYIRSICIKHFNFKKEFNDYFGEYTKELVNYLNNLIDNSESLNKQKFVKYYLNDYYFDDICIIYGILYYYGIEDVVEKNYEKSLKFINIAFYNSDNSSYKRFCYTYIYKIKEKLLSIIKNSEDKIKEEKELIEIKNEIFKMYYKGLYDDSIKTLSSSYYYYLSRLYNKKIGTNEDDLFEYIFLNQALNAKNNGNLSSNSFIVYYRQYKAKIKIKDKNKENYYDKLKCVEGYIHVEGYGDDGLICPICYDKKKTTICLPCKHFFCSRCLEQLKEKKCPICRNIILLAFDIENKKQITMK